MRRALWRVAWSTTLPFYKLLNLRAKLLRPMVQSYSNPILSKHLEMPPLVDQVAAHPTPQEIMPPLEISPPPKRCPEKVPGKSGGASRRASRPGDQAGGKEERKGRIAGVATD